MDTPLPSNEAGRLGALRRYEINPTSASESFDGLVRLAASTCGTPIALFALIDEERIFVKSRIGIELSEIPRGSPLVAHEIGSRAPVVISDMLRDRRVANHPLVTGTAGTRFYAGAPVVTPEGYTIGFLAVLAREPRTMDPAQIDSLRTIATAIVTQLEADRQASVLQRSEQVFRTLVQNSTDMIAVLDAYGTIRYISPAIEGMIGYRPDEMVGKNGFEYIHPDDRGAVINAFAEAVGNPERTPTVQYRGMHRNGSLVYSESTGKNMLDDPIVNGLVINGRDISERVRFQETHALLRGLLEATTDFVAAADRDGQIVWMNRAARELRGLGPTEDVTGLRITDFYPPEEITNILKVAIPTAIRDGIWQGETVALSATGALIACDQKIIAQKDETGTVRYLSSVGRDITEYKGTLRALESARHVAEAANRAKSDFLATMSHEIRTPLNGVIGMSSLLLDTALSAQQREFAEMAKRSGEGLLGLIDDILDFSKIEAGKLDFETVDFDLHQLVEDAVELFAERADAADVELLCAIDPGVPRQVRGDPGRLRQVLINLLGNAVRFTPAGEIVVRVTSAAHAVQFEVRDTGIGISPAGRAKLFEPYRQADNSTTRRFGGTGLGLAICKRLVHLMGGDIGVESEPGKGSRFFFRLALPATESALSSNPDPHPLRDSRVLVVDANSTYRAWLKAQFGAWSVPCEEAIDAASALTTLLAAQQRGESFNIAILAIRLPDIDGLELARRIRSNSALRETALVLLTSRSRRDRDAERNAGFAAALTKPVRSARLLETLVAIRTGASPTVAAVPSAPQTFKVENGLRVLVAEDNVVNQKLAAEFLSKLGYQVDVVANGEDAVEAVRQVKYAAMLMDCQMPRMDGFEAARRIRSAEDALPAENGTRLRLPIIAMTANAMSGDRELCLAAGMDDYLPKPVRLDVLRKALARWLAAK